MTDNTTTEAPSIDLPTTPEYKLAYILATLHSCHLMGDDDIVLRLLDSLHIALSEDDVRAVYESEAVDEYLRQVQPILYPSKEVLNILADEAAEAYWDNLSDEEREEMLKVIESLFSDEEEVQDPLHAFKAPELIKDGQCNSPGCVCHDDEDDNEELLAETDEFIIVKIWK